MKAKILIPFVLFVAMAFGAYSACTFTYTNKDTKTYTTKVSIDDTNMDVVFEASKTASITIPGTASKCSIRTPCGVVTINNGGKFQIINGCIKILNTK